MKFIFGIALLALMTPITAASPVCAADGCCKTCKAGKPCGDTCIAKDKACDKPKGCACQG